jgi:shikimate dehydrogenase
MTKGITFGLIGYPLKHSLSAFMHNAAFVNLKIKAKYKLFPLKEDEVSSFFLNLAKNNIRGLNITIPYKERVLRLPCVRVNSAVKSIGAANTLLVDKAGRFKFFNTDYLGFLRHLKELKLKPKRVGILGAGGASKAISFALGKSRALEVVIYDIDHFRSLSLMRRFNRIFPNTKFIAVGNIEELRLKDKDLLINASPIGMKATDSLIINRKDLHRGIFVYDLIYNPKETKLLKAAKEVGANCSNGLSMLLYQAVESLNIWLSPKSSPIKAMQAALKSAVKRIQ